MKVLIVHKRRVRLPAHGFTAHKLQRMFLTRRHATRLAPPAPILARRAKHTAPTRYAMSEIEFSEARRLGHGWTLASAALILLVVVLACCASHVRLW